MVQYIDLTIEITENMPVHPLDDKIKLFQNRFIAKDGFNGFKLENGMHIGTHMDAPMHFTSDNRFISNFEIDRFLGSAKLLDVRGESTIICKDIYDKTIEKDDIVILFTGHSSKFGHENYYYDHPVMDETLADFFIDKGIKLVGMDLPSPDASPYNIHKKLLQNDIFIIENLTNLDKLISVTKFEILALPLKIKAEASPVRVIAKYEN